MSALLDRIVDLLRDAAVPYELIRHHSSYTAQEAAHDTHTPGRLYLKTVVIWIDGHLVLAVLPASHLVDLSVFQRALRASVVRLASEPEIEARFPGCEVGAIPPLSAVVDAPIYSALRLSDEEPVTFLAGSHRASVRLSYGDLRRLSGAVTLDFAAKAPPQTHAIAG